MADAGFKWGTFLLILLLILMFFIKGCSFVSCETWIENNFGGDEETTTTTTTTQYEPPSTTTTTMEITCSETLQGVCEGSCPEGQSCEVINILIGQTCKCVDLQGAN